MDRTAVAGADPERIGHDEPASSAPPGPVLTAEQQAALDLLLQAVADGAEAALLGPAGSGKTTVVRQLLRRLEAEGRLVEALVLAPTHKARRQVEQGLAMEVRTTTVASVLRLKPAIHRITGAVEFLRDESRDPLEAAAIRSGPAPRLLLCDEASMVSIEAGDQLANVAEQLEAALIWVGDPAQLPPVNDGVLSPRLTGCKRSARLETVMRTGVGPVLELSVALRKAEHPSQAWPARSVAHGDSKVLVHRHPNHWIAAAHEVIGSEAWAENPDLARVVAWTHLGCKTVSSRLRSMRWGAAADRWHPGEWISAVHGLPTEGAALDNPRCPASTELQIVQVGEPQVLSELYDTIEWKTPRRGFVRSFEIGAEATVCRVVLADRTGSGEQHEAWLELPGQQGKWEEQVKRVRSEVRAHIHGEAARRTALQQVADLRSLVPDLRPAEAMTVHAAQGSSFEQVWVWRDLAWCPLEKGVRELAYVSVSRAEKAVHLLPWSG